MHFPVLSHVINKYLFHAGVKPTTHKLKIEPTTHKKKFKNHRFGFLGGDKNRYIHEKPLAGFFPIGGWKINHQDLFLVGIINKS